MINRIKFNAKDASDGKIIPFFNTKWFLCKDSIIIEKSGLVIVFEWADSNKIVESVVVEFQQVLIIPLNAKTDEDVYVFGNNLEWQTENSESLRST